MAQQYQIFINPDTGLKVRIGARDVDNDSLPEYVIDKELTSAGFNGVEDTDWENISYSK